MLQLPLRASFGPFIRRAVAGACAGSGTPVGYRSIGMPLDLPALAHHPADLVREVLAPHALSAENRAMLPPGARS